MAILFLWLNDMHCIANNYISLFNKMYVWGIEENEFVMLKMLSIVY